jgi:hypothetical protein
MATSWHETVKASAPPDIRDFSTIDRQIEEQFSSKVCSSLHDQATALVVMARKARSGRIASAKRFGSRYSRLTRSDSDQDRASQTKNQESPTRGVVS